MYPFFTIHPTLSLTVFVYPHPSFSEQSTHLLVTRRFFERSQRAQRRLLCFGESLDARDIEPLVGAIPPQGAQMLATREVPDGDSAIVSTTGERSAIGTRLEGLDCSLVRLLRLHTLSALDIPPAEHTVTAATDQHRAGGAPGQRIDHLARLVPVGEARPRLRIPDEEFPLAPAPTDTGQPRPIGTLGHAHNGPLMPRQSLEQPAIGGVPHIEVIISGPSDQPCPIGAPGQSTDPGG